LKKQRTPAPRPRHTPVGGFVSVLVGVALTIISGCASAAPLDDLASAIAARLSLMDDVARYKWNHSLPIVDEQREAKLVERATAQAVTFGVPADYARRVVVAQIEASRARQTELTTQWRAQHHAPFDGVPDLATAQRPAIDAATTNLLRRLRAAMCELDSAAAQAVFADPPAGLEGAKNAWSTATAVLWPAPDCPH
jgi:cyclohexadienyl dehydratase